MRNILLTHSYILNSDPKQLRTGQPYAPLGTLYAASMLRNSGIGFSFYDPTFASGMDEFASMIRREKPSFLVIYDDLFNYLSKMCMINMRVTAFEMIKLGRENGARVIICSADAMDNHKLYLENGASYVITGEGEITLKELMIELISNPATPKEIPGTVFINNGEVRVAAPRTPADDPDIFPFPARDLLDIGKYRGIWLRKNDHYTMNMVTTRGCPYKCIWCAKPVYGNRYAARSPQNVADEMAFLQQNYHPDEIWFADDIFGLKPGWIKEFSKLVKENGIHLPFVIQSRVDLILNDNQAMPLADSGCKKIWLGIESGSQKILDTMQKGITVEQIKQVSPLLRNAGIEQAFFLQLGFPGETRDDINKTISLLTSLMPDDIGISVTYPLPGTRFYEAVRERIGERTNWTDSDDLVPLAVSDFPADYYKPLHRFIHKFYRFRQAIWYLKKIMSGKKPANGTMRRIMLMPWYMIFAIYYKLILLKKQNVVRRYI